MRLLLVEDDDLLGDGLLVGLRQAGYTVDWIKDGILAEIALIDDKFDLVVLDIGLPGQSGLSVLRKLRERNITTPVLILTAMDSIEDRVSGLDCGADDYLVKPFDLEELCARLRVLQRRQSGRASPILEHGSIKLNPASHQVYLDDKKIGLSQYEYIVLQCLLENIGRVVSRQKLEQSLYGWDGGVESNAIEVFIHHLRKKFGINLIRTIRGTGYIIEETS